MRAETSTEPVEPVLPVTPSNEGRSPKINNFGYNLPFDDLWAVGAGIGLSVLVTFTWVLGLLPGPWYLKIIAVMVPSIAGHMYTKVWIEDALPHVQRDMIARVLALRVDFQRPRWKRLPFIPSFHPDLSMGGEPEVNDGGGHPLHRMREMHQQRVK